MKPLGTAPTELEQVTTHDSIFTRGYEAGYFAAKIEDRASFRRDVLTSRQVALTKALAGSGAKVRVGPPVRRKYSVNWTPMEVEFPEAVDS